MFKGYRLGSVLTKDIAIELLQSPWTYTIGRCFHGFLYSLRVIVDVNVDVIVETKVFQRSDVFAFCGLEQHWLLGQVLWMWLKSLFLKTEP